MNHIIIDFKFNIYFVLFAIISFLAVGDPIHWSDYGYVQIALIIFGFGKIVAQSYRLGVYGEEDSLV